MKNLVQLAITATLAIGATANSHHHMHRHAKKHAALNVNKRAADANAQAAAPAVEIVYQLDGHTLDASQAEAGLKDGEYVVVGETNPVNPSPPPAPAAPKPAPAPAPAPAPPAAPKAKNIGAQFLEKPDTDKHQVPSVPAPAPAPKKEQPAKPKTPSQPSQPSVPSGGTGLNAEFPSGQVKCSDFPSKYGAIPLDWLNFGGYSGLQFVPKFSMKASLSISNIVTGITGDKCSPGCLCSYSCPPGYQKTQWPKAQGSTLQSAGGLHCNSDGYLELTRPESTTLCEPGAGGVFIHNGLDEVVTACRTDYPGTENMVIPLEAEPGQTVEVTNPIQNAYYIWDGKPTSAQYYINKKGLSASDCCRWTCPNDPLGCGNWAPMVLGVGQAEDGTTFLSIFQNLPTSTALLNFNVEITGDVNSKCAFKNGQWIGGATGCTTGMKKGGRATIRYS
ncbi:hypothetical protein E4U55_005376 [Claviceps digitariae]|nr:hypothetical protein E4U55_005376 [Claviceps digitariae]